VAKGILPSIGGILVGALASGCGESRHADAGEPKGRFTVQVTHASFPTEQAVARQTRLALRVRNAGARTLPNVTVAVTSFYYRSQYHNLASSLRPVWVVNEGPGKVADPPVETVQTDPPGSGGTANYDVWALGPLAPGATRTFVWNVSPVKPGVHRLAYRVYGGLNGRARAELAGGAPPVGHFTVHIAARPPQTHVSPTTGKVVAGPYVPSEG